MKMSVWVLARFVFLAVVILWVGNWLAASFLIDNWSTRGTFGDMFGAINALFSGLAFGGVIVAILLQQQALEHQRQEQKDSSDALAKQLEALEITALMNCLSTMIGTYDRRIFEAIRSGSLNADRAREISEQVKQVDHLTQKLEALYKYVESKRSSFPEVGLSG